METTLIAPRTLTVGVAVLGLTVLPIVAIPTAYGSVLLAVLGVFLAFVLSILYMEKRINESYVSARSDDNNPC